MNLMCRQQNENGFLSLIKGTFSLLGSYIEFQSKSEFI